MIEMWGVPGHSTVGWFRTSTVRHDWSSYLWIPGKGMSHPLFARTGRKNSRRRFSGLSRSLGPGPRVQGMGVQKTILIDLPGGSSPTAIFLPPSPS